MYCHKCGTKAENKCCEKCGTKIVSLHATIIESWRSSSNFREIAKHPEVLKLIEKYSKDKNRKITYESLINENYEITSTHILYNSFKPLFGKL